MGYYKNIKVYDVNSDTDYTGSTWLNIEVKLDEKKNVKMKTLPIAIISMTAFVIGLGLHDNLIALMGFIGQCTALIIQQFQKIKPSNPLFEKVSYQITLHQLNLDNLKGIPETLVNVKSWIR